MTFVIVQLRCNPGQSSRRKPQTHSGVEGASLCTTIRLPRDAATSMRRGHVHLLVSEQIVRRPAACAQCPRPCAVPNRADPGAKVDCWARIPVSHEEKMLWWIIDITPVKSGRAAAAHRQYDSRG